MGTHKQCPGYIWVLSLCRRGAPFRNPRDWAPCALLAVAGISVTGSGWNRCPLQTSSQQGWPGPGCRQYSPGKPLPGTALGLGSQEPAHLSLPCPGVCGEQVGGLGSGEQVGKTVTPKKVREQDLAGWKSGSGGCGHSPRPPGEGRGGLEWARCFGGLPIGAQTFSEYLPWARECARW